MAVTLQKGGNLSLTKSSPNLKRIMVGLGWSARSSDGDDFDLDASIFMVTEAGKVRCDEEFIFYGSKLRTARDEPRSPCESVIHHGDDRTGGDGEGDDEAIEVTLAKVPDAIKRLIVTVTIYEADLRGQNFGQVSGAFIRIVNVDNDQEIARFDLSEDYSTETAMIFGEVYRHGGEWKFKAVGQGYTGGLEALCRQFGVNVA
jgi:tellurium resistance protein TerD